MLRASSCVKPLALRWAALPVRVPLFHQPGVGLRMVPAQLPVRGVPARDGLDARCVRDLCVLDACTAQLSVDGGDKRDHVLAYTTLMPWFAWLYRRVTTRLFFAPGFVVLGIALEFAQGTTDYRSFELADMAADGIGVVLGWGIARLPLPNLFVVVESRLLDARR